jgi:hypothetical protein
LKKYLLSLLLIVFSGLTSRVMPFKVPEFDRQALHQQAVKESLIPVRPGVPGKSPFWNVNSSQFIFVPSFDFSTVPGAENYRFKAVSEADGKEYVFQAGEPWATLAPIWQELPVGYVSLEVAGLDSSGIEVGKAGNRRFYRSAVFDGPYGDSLQYDYTESARRALQYLFNNDYLRKWSTEGAPDSSYFLYCYPSKMVAAIIQGMLLYSRLAPADSSAALSIAIDAGKYLVEHSQPLGSPLAYFPPTYDPTDLDSMNYKDDPPYIYRDQIMLIYPPQVALAYLDLYGVTGDKAFMIEAEKIADTFARIQLADGNWPLKMDIRTGEAVGSNFARVGTILEFYNRLRKDFGIERYNGNILAARPNYLRPFEEYNFEGQFEDVEPSRPYQNLSHYAAVEAATYFLNYAFGRPENLKKAREYLRFAEDQFVVWERPCPIPRPEKQDRLSDDWITPCALEQYDYYVPIDASAANFISVFLKAYQVTKDPLYLAKALSLANSMVAAQDKETGKYPTYWWKSLIDRFGWINCAIYSAEAMYRFGSFLK